MNQEERVFTVHRRTTQYRNYTIIAKDEKEAAKKGKGKGEMKCPKCGEILIPYIGSDGEEYYDCPRGDYNSEDERYQDYLNER